MAKLCKNCIQLVMGRPIDLFLLAVLWFQHPHFRPAELDLHVLLGDVVGEFKQDFLGGERPRTHSISRVQMQPTKMMMKLDGTGKFSDSYIGEVALRL